MIIMSDIVLNKLIQITVEFLLYSHFGQQNNVDTRKQ